MLSPSFVPSSTLSAEIVSTADSAPMAMRSTVPTSSIIPVNISFSLQNKNVPKNGDIKKSLICTSHIQTILSALESHQILSHCDSRADVSQENVPCTNTVGRELHAAPKFISFILYHSTAFYPLQEQISASIKRSSPKEVIFWSVSLHA
jgi:hypothetical protein